MTESRRDLLHVSIPTQSQCPTYDQDADSALASRIERWRQGTLQHTGLPDTSFLHRYTAGPTAWSLDTANAISSQPAMYNHEAHGLMSRTPAFDNGHAGPRAELSGLQHASRFASRPASPVFTSGQNEAKNKNSSSSFLLVPGTITSARSSLSEFAAMVTCLFWFEAPENVMHIERYRSYEQSNLQLVPDASPSISFQKWVTTLLSTTQVTQNVVLLALLFIHRLKEQYPSVKGKPGSEYRLLTVALMLGNKFLDDNTYTNKTWAEVSGISVQEIHVMEVEFLSHMKYNLYTSEEEWQAWHKRLAVFWSFFETASRHAHPNPAPSSVLRPLHHIGPSLPSPPYSTNSNSPYTTASPASHAKQGSMPVMYPHTTPSMHTPPSLPLPDAGTVSRAGRKRSADATAAVHASKRSHLECSSHYGDNVPQSSGGGADHPYLHLPPPTSIAADMSGRIAYRQPVAPLSSLPTPTGMQLTPISAYSTPARSGVFEHATRPQYYMNHQTPPAVAAGHTLPAIMAANPAPKFVSAASHATAQHQLSPSHFLTKRDSPYRPVRDISTLLVAPPPGSFHNPAAHVSLDQMKWQTLAKTDAECRTGRLPYVNNDAWPHTHHFTYWPGAYSINQQA